MSVQSHPLFSELTPQQQRFCLLLAGGAVSQEAASQAFQTTSKASARAIGSKLLKNTVIRAVCGLPRLKPQTRSKANARDMAELQNVQTEQNECSEYNGVRFTAGQRSFLEGLHGEDRQEWRRDYYIQNHGADFCLLCKKPLEPRPDRIYCDDVCRQLASKRIDESIAANGGQLPTEFASNREFVKEPVALGA